MGLGDERLFNGIELVNNVKWDRQGVRYYFLYYVVAITLLSILIAGLDFGWTNDILIKGLVTGLSIGVILGLLSGFTNSQIEQSRYPGQKLSLSIKNFVYFFLAFGPLIGISLALVSSIVYQETINQLNLILITAVGALVGGLICGGMFGGFAVLHHLSLRIVLARNHHLPLHLIPFLDHCVDLIFLRRVGGGYIFVHRLLMEHFADMYPADEK